MNDKKLRASLIRLAHAKPELRAELLPLLKQAMEHATPEAMKDYLHEHPKADPKDHRVAPKEDKPKGKSEEGEKSTHIKGDKALGGALQEWQGKSTPGINSAGSFFTAGKEVPRDVAEKAHQEIKSQIEHASSYGHDADAVKHLKKIDKELSKVLKTAGIGTMQVNYIKRDALELVEAVQSQEAVEIMFLQLLDSCTAFAKYGLKNMAVSRILDKAVDLLADTEGSTLDTTGEPSRTFID